MTANTPDQHVLIIGAGIVGLLIAQGFTKEGIPCTVFESEPSGSHYRPREWGMSIQWGLPLLKTIFTPEKFSQIHTAAVDPNYDPPDPEKMPTFNGATGEFIKYIPLLRMYRVSRRKFRLFCAEGINILYGKTLSSITYPNPGQVTATFADGTSSTGTLLIGADGTHSTVRQLIFNNAPTALAKTVPYNAINLHVHYNSPSKALHVRQHHPIMYHAIHPLGYWLFIAVQDIPDPNDPSTWVFQLQCTWKKGNPNDPCRQPDGTENDPSSLEMHMKRAETFGEPFKSANLWLPKDTKLNVNQMSYWIPEPWDSRDGMVILAGDAAHPMTFQRGQGLNHGIADAVSITKLLARVKKGDMGREEAVREYMDEMIPRVGEEVKGSLGNTEMLHDWEKMMGSAIMERGGHANVGNKSVDEKSRLGTYEKEKQP